MQQQNQDNNQNQNPTLQQYDSYIAANYNTATPAQPVVQQQPNLNSQPVASTPSLPQATQLNPVTHPALTTQYAQPSTPVSTDFLNLSINSDKPVGAPKKTLFSSIVKASVEIEKVTRQSVTAVKHSFEPPNIDLIRTKKQKLIARSFYALGAMSFVMAVYFGFQTLTKKDTPKSVLGSQTNIQNDTNRVSEIPSEQVPSQQDISTYLVASEYPRYMRIPSLKINTRIRRLGLDRKGAVGTPNNIHDAGWYDSSAKPGDKDGSSIIVGHIAGPTMHGLFWDLPLISQGTIIEIEKGNGFVIRYKVSKIEKIPNDSFDISKYLVQEAPGKNDLKLITATNKFNTVSGDYTQRVVVFAEIQ